MNRNLLNQKTNLICQHVRTQLSQTRIPYVHAETAITALAQFIMERGNPALTRVGQIDQVLTRVTAVLVGKYADVGVRDQIEKAIHRAYDQVNLSTDTQTRLTNIQQRLKEQGVVDVKFAWSPDLQNMTTDKVGQDVATFMEAFLDGKLKELNDVGDRPVICENATHDLDLSMWESIKKAARESRWIPEEYFMNDWAADVRAYLIGDVFDQQKAREDRIKEAWAVSLVDENSATGDLKNRRKLVELIMKDRGIG